MTAVTLRMTPVMLKMTPVILGEIAVILRLQRRISAARTTYRSGPPGTMASKG